MRTTRAFHRSFRTSLVRVRAEEGETIVEEGKRTVRHLGQPARICLLATLAALVSIPVALTTVACGLGPPAGRILQGVWIGPVAVGGLNAAEAREAVSSWLGAAVLKPIELSSGDKTWVIGPDDIRLTVDVSGAVEAALSLGRSGSLARRLRERRQAVVSGIRVTPDVHVDEGILRQTVAAIARAIRRSPKDARLVIGEDDTVTIVPSTNGLDISEESVLREAKDAFFSPDRRRELTPVVWEPSTTTEDIASMGIVRLLASYTTRFDPSQESRISNIRLACSALSGVLVPPGQEFSFNATVGPRDSGRGFREAPVVLGDELVPGIGGGVCQVSTTLYNAVLLAGLRVTSRHSHSIAPAYVPPGMDATVAYNYRDLRFVNNTGKYIYIAVSCTRSTISAKIYGRDPGDLTFRTRTQVLKRTPYSVRREVDPTLAPGQTRVAAAGSYGYEVAVWRVRVQGDREVSSELVSRDRYAPSDRVIKVGPLPPGQPPPFHTFDSPARLW